MSEIGTFPHPVVDPYSTPFWEATRARRLSVQQCASCGALRFPPGPACPHCFLPDAVWIDLSGRGTVRNWVIFHHNYFRRHNVQVPYAVALVELDEGIKLFTNLRGVEPDAIAAGLRVQVVFEQFDDRFTLPCFAPCAEP